MIKRFNFFEYTVIYLFSKMIDKYIDGRFCELSHDELKSELNVRALSIFYFNYSNNLNYFAQKKFNEIYNESATLSNIFIYSSYLFDIHSNQFNQYSTNVMVIKDFIKLNDISITDFKKSFSHFFSNFDLYMLIGNNNYIPKLEKNLDNLMFNIISNNYKNIFENNHEEILVIAFGIFNIIFSNEKLIKYYMLISIEKYIDNVKNFDYKKEQSPIFRAINHLKQINFIKSYSNRRNLVLYTFNKININNNQYTLKLYQHDFILAWFANYTSIHEFDVFLNGQRRTIDKINSSLTSNGMKLIKTKSFKSTIINFTENNTLNLSIYKYLSKLK